MREPKQTKGKKHVSHKHSVKQERRTAQLVGGRLVRGSGNGNEKGDVRRVGSIRVENKCTAKVRSDNPKDGYKITIEMIDKIESAALPCNEAPAIEVEFIDEKGNVLHEWALVPTYVLRTIADHYHEYMGANNGGLCEKIAECN